MPLLEEGARVELLVMARSILEVRLAGGGLPDYQPRHADLLLHLGAFVSLHHGPDLRGCIGRMWAVEPLHSTVARCAVSAALEDSRFSPVRREELAQVTLEISVLSPCLRIDNPETVEVGRHGLRISRGHHRGVLLPQVASQNGWNRETFLAQACRKAGLPAEAWRDASTEIEVFTAEVFAETDFANDGDPFIRATGADGLDS